MTNIHESVKIFAKYAKKENRAMEKLIKLTPLFVKKKEFLITLLGIDTPLREI